MRKPTCLLLLANLLALPAFAGGMVSSGGQLLRDANNPWWVKNTDRVRYCVEMDAKSISAQPDRAVLLVAEALEYWRGEFSRKLKIVNQKAALNAAFNAMGVGTQEFTLVDCDGAEDLRFKLGYGTLSAEEKAFIPDLSTHVSAAVRSSYDEATLRGRGFVYIASDLGPYQFDGGPHTIATPWKHDIFLYLALVHELGHVFGLPHIGETYSLMSAQFLEAALSKPIAAGIQSVPIVGIPKQSFFFFPANYFVRCAKEGFPEPTARFLGLASGVRCLHFGVDGDERRIVVLSATEIEGPKTLVGVLTGLDLDADPSVGITAYLSEKQAVFPAAPHLPRVAFGPLFIGKRGSATFVPRSGPARPVYLDLNPRSFTLASIQDGVIRTMLTLAVEMVPHY